MALISVSLHRGLFFSVIDRLVFEMTEKKVSLVGPLAQT